MSTAYRPVALVTGASSGLGRQFAVQLARSGHDLVLVARDVGRLNALSAEVHGRFATSAEVLAADLSRDEDVSRVVARIDESPVAVLVNNAGFGTRGSMVNASREMQDAMLRVHVLAAHRLAHAAVQGMAARGGGTVINVSSVASFLTSSGNVNYCASKGFLRLYAEGLSQELARYGIYVQAFCPGFVHTEFHERGRMNKSRYPSWMWMTSERVVAESLEAMRRRRPVVVVPGIGYRLAVSLLRHVPPRLRVAVTEWHRARGRREKGKPKSGVDAGQRVDPGP